MTVPMTEATTAPLPLAGRSTDADRGPEGGAETHVDPDTGRDEADRTVRLHALSFVPEDGDVMVGRADTGSYAVFPPAGAEVLRLLAAGGTVADAEQLWWRRTGEALDSRDLLQTLADLGFLVADDEPLPVTAPVRWQRLARAAFSPVAWGVYLATIVAAVVAMVLDPGLRPTYHHFFFTDHIIAIPLVLTFGQIPLIVLHEAYHALAARRRGLPSSVGIGRRFVYLVAETRLDALYSVPRRERYLPFLAGVLIDAVVVSAFTLAAAVLQSIGAPTTWSGLALAFALSSLLRTMWQGLFYLETDVYFAINAASRCTDLHGAAAYRLRGWWARLRRRDLDPAAGDADDWSARDHAAARWYAVLMVFGYGLSLFTLLWVGLPTSVTFWTTVAQRLFGSGPVSAATLVDTLLFVALTGSQLVMFVYVTIRDRRARRQGSATGPTPDRASDITSDRTNDHANDVGHDIADDLTSGRTSAGATTERITERDPR